MFLGTSSSIQQDEKQQDVMLPSVGKTHIILILIMTSENTLLYGKANHTFFIHILLSCSYATPPSSIIMRDI